MKQLAERVFKTEVSGIRKVFDLAAKLKNPINLSIGQPDFDVEENIKQEAISAINAGKNAYTQTQGGPELRSVLKKYLNNKYDDQQILVTSAVSGGLLLALLAILDVGDEILVPDPYFVMYKQLALMLGAKPVYYDTYPNWKLDPEKIAKLITKKTKAIIICSPNNPTGAVYNQKELQEIAEVLKKNEILAISDEIYEAYCYDQEYASMGDIYRENTLVLGGCSKSHAMTGWRIGWAAGPEKLIQAMTKFQQFTFVCAPAPFQIAAAKALEKDLPKQVEEYKTKRNLMYKGLLEAGYEVEKPQGAFYIFPKVPWGTDEEFVAECINNNLLVIPGSVFSEKNTHFRIAYTATEEVINKGIEVLKKIVKKP